MAWEIQPFFGEIGCLTQENIEETVRHGTRYNTSIRKSTGGVNLHTFYNGESRVIAFENEYCFVYVERIANGPKYGLVIKADNAEYYFFDSSNQYSEVYFSFVYDDSLQYGGVVVNILQTNSIWLQRETNGSAISNNNTYYAIKNSPYVPPVTYQWQSVPAITGKNGILVAMSTISDMNDGEPVTTTDTTKFTLVEESNVGVITEDIDDSIKPGADAGGISGNGENSAEQLYGYAFGQGETASGVSGGGGGLYGGFAGNLAE